MTTLVINPTSIISTFCYSVFRLETSSSCTFSCTYCYARWYRFEKEELTEKHVREFKLFLKFVRRRKLEKMPVFRMSTLVEPFQPTESCLRRSTQLLRLCVENEVPLIINTKSTLVVEVDEIFSNLLKLADRRLCVVQITLTTLREDVAKILEPNAPSPEGRLEVIDKLCEHSVPIAVRYQPLVPGVCDDEYLELLRSIAKSYVRHIICEVLRCDSQTLKVLQERLPKCASVKWRPYIRELTAGLLRPDNDWRIEIMRKIRSTCDALGLGFATCKEGLLQLHTVPDCCGMYMLDQEKILYKFTIYEVSKVLRETNVNSWRELVENVEKSDSRCVFLTFRWLKYMPASIRRKLVKHYKTLFKVVQKRELLARFSQTC